MATKTEKAKKKASTGTRKRRGIKLKPTALTAPELGVARLEGADAMLAEQVQQDGGAVLAAYREPLGGRLLMLVALPVERVAPTPYQRDLSDAHVRKLVRAMDKTRRFLDPIIVVREAEGYFTPNGHHRLAAVKELGAKAIVALLVPEPEVAFQILALNIEKAHSLRERSREVARMYRALAASGRKESDCELELEEPALATLGFAYEARPRLAGGAYHPVLRKADTWINLALERALPERERRARLLLELDDAVGEAVARLKAAGLQSPYLKSFVVARVNPLRFIQGEPPELEALFKGMARRAAGLKADRIKPSDLMRGGGPASADPGTGEE